MTDQPRGVDQEGSTARATTFADLWPASAPHVRALFCDPRLEAEYQAKVKLDSVYRERDFVVSLAALLLIRHAPLPGHELATAFLRYDDSAGWDEDWRWTVVMVLPTGEVSWHIHDSELSLFARLVRVTIQPDGVGAAFVWPVSGGVTIGSAEGYRYDGYSTDEKYRRIWEYVTGRRD